MTEVGIDMTKKHTHQKDKTPETQAEQLSEQENEITSETNLTAEKVIVDMTKVENPQTDAEPNNTKLKFWSATVRRR